MFFFFFYTVQQPFNTTHTSTFPALSLPSSPPPFSLHNLFLPPPHEPTDHSSPPPPFLHRMRPLPLTWPWRIYAAAPLIGATASSPASLTLVRTLPPPPFHTCEWLSFFRFLSFYFTCSTFFGSSMFCAWFRFAGGGCCCCSGNWGSSFMYWRVRRCVTRPFMLKGRFVSALWSFLLMSSALRA